MEKLINKVFKLTKKAELKDEFPVAAIIYKDNKIISYAYNKRNKSQMTIDHAEIIAIQKANKKLHSWRLDGYNMIVSLEPCDMCKSIIKESRIDNVYYILNRYEYKKQCKKSKFIQIHGDEKIVEKYKMSVNTFFKSKR